MSFDGGATWPVHGVVFETGTDPAYADPALAFDEFGNLYACYIGNRLHVAVSTDGGVTFPPALNEEIFDDVKNRLIVPDYPRVATGPAAGSAQSVWISVTDKAEGEPRRIVAVGAEVTGPLNRNGPPPAYTVHEVEVGDRAYADIAVGPGGKVAITYQEARPIAPFLCPTDIFVKTRDAAAASDLAVVFEYPTEMPLGTSNVCGLIGVELVSAHLAAAGPALEWDREADRVYLAYLREPKDESNDTDVYLRIGTGPALALWTSPVAVAENAGHQLHQTIAPDPASGRVAFSWYNGGSPASPGIEYFLTYGFNGGLSFKGGFQVSSGPSGTLSKGNDYTALAFLGGSFFPCWGDSGYPGVQAWDVLERTLAPEDCADGMDNDGDQRLDCADPTCCGGPSCPEVCEDCADARDNDGDGLADCRDPDCFAVCGEKCSDLMDNDGDLLIDCTDPDCHPSCPENCLNAVDDDADGLADCADPECEAACPENCTDGGIDNDADGLADCADPECSSNPVCN